jgi:hypothetical protein
VESLFFLIFNYLYRARNGGSLGSCGGARSEESGGGGGVFAYAGGGGRGGGVDVEALVRLEGLCVSLLLFNF